MTKEETLYCMKANSVLHPEICEECPLYGDTGIDHCFEDALDEAIKALEQEPCEDVAKECYEDLCRYFGDAKDILKNREDFKAWLDRIKWHIRKAEELRAENDDLRDQLAMRDKFQKQEPKTGHWIHFASGDDCSECGWSTGKYISPSRYCPGCGCLMVEPQDVDATNYPPPKGSGLPAPATLVNDINGRLSDVFKENLDRL